MNDPDVAVGIGRRAGHLAERPTVRDVRPGWIDNELWHFHLGGRQGRSGGSSARSGNRERRYDSQNHTCAHKKQMAASFSFRARTIT
jgi:hypothetical protein